MLPPAEEQQHGRSSGGRAARAPMLPSAAAAWKDLEFLTSQEVPVHGEGLLRQLEGMAAAGRPEQPSEEAVPHTRLARNWRPRRRPEEAPEEAEEEPEEAEEEPQETEAKEEPEEPGEPKEAKEEPPATPPRSSSHVHDTTTTASDFEDEEEWWWYEKVRWEEKDWYDQEWRLRDWKQWHTRRKQWHDETEVLVQECDEEPLREVQGPIAPAGSDPSHPYHRTHEIAAEIFAGAGVQRGAAPKSNLTREVEELQQLSEGPETSRPTPAQEPEEPQEEKVVERWKTAAGRRMKRTAEGQVKYCSSSVGARTRRQAARDANPEVQRMRADRAEQWSRASGLLNYTAARGDC